MPGKDGMGKRFLDCTKFSFSRLAFKALRPQAMALFSSTRRKSRSIASGRPGAYCIDTLEANGPGLGNRDTWHIWQVYINCRTRNFHHYYHYYYLIKGVMSLSQTLLYNH